MKYTALRQTTAPKPGGRWRELEAPQRSVGIHHAKRMLALATLTIVGSAGKSALPPGLTYPRCRRL